VFFLKERGENHLIEMDSQENANIQTIEQPAKTDEKLKTIDAAPKQATPTAKPEKPKPTYKCLVCGKS